jgi:transcriptional regulator with XRE-family HTH domain
MTETRRRNLALLRVILPVTQDDFGRAFNRNQTEVSRLETGKDDVSDYLAKEIERGLGLPDGWLSRNNAELLLSAPEYEMVGALRCLDAAVAQRVTDLVRELGLKRG